MYNKHLSQIKFLISTGAIGVFVIIYLALLALFSYLKTTSIFYRNVIALGLSFFIPMNIISWLCFGQFGGILIFLFSCLSIILIVLKYGILSYNIYIVLFGITAVAGYRFFLNLTLAKNKLLAKIETLEGDKNILSSKISQREKDINAAKTRLKGYTALKDITEELSTTLNLKEIANLITEKAFDIIGKSDRAFLFLIDEEKQELTLSSYKQISGLSPINARRGDLFDNWILKHRRSLIIEDLDNDFRFSPEALRDPGDRGFKSIIGTPLISEMKVAGVLHLDSNSKAAYSQDDLRLLDIISDLAALSIENSLLYQRTNRLAITDSLTGLYVHRFFKERLDAELKKVRENKGKFSILMIDLDYFKDYNDRYGHAAGDILLGKVAWVLKTNVAPEHIISRYGGEEFAIILVKTDKRSAIKISEALRQKIEASIFTLRRDQVRITVSIGISSFPEDGSALEELLKKADENLYKAKEDGRNRVCSGPA